MDVSFLVRRKFIPDVSLHLPKLSNKRFPSWYYAQVKLKEQIHQLYPIYINSLLREKFLGNDANYFSLWKSMTGLDLPEKSKNPLSSLTLHDLPKDVTFVDDHFYNDDMIALLCCSTSPAKEIDAIALRLFTLACMKRRKGSPLIAAGVIFFLQQEIMWIDISDWQEGCFSDFMRLEEIWSMEDVQAQTFPFCANYGNHLCKEVVLQPCFKQYNRASQIFISNPQGRSTINYQELELIRDNLPEEPVFCHGKYIYNLCKEEDWIIASLKEELQASLFAGLRGTVIHCGKSKGMNYEQALNKMEKGMREALTVASKECPLILETSARQGTEILSNLDELVDFYSRFPDKDKVKICVDTCHVFAAGYDPLHFLQTLEDKHPKAVVLVHFNDSKECRNSCKDRHESPGLGKIGYERMKRVYAFCSLRGIPMVQE